MTNGASIILFNNVQPDMTASASPILGSAGLRSAWKLSGSVLVGFSIN
jgi:hypothetical protein